MGTSRRYPHVIDKQMDARISQRVMETGEPDTLTKAELALDREPMTRAPVPRPVRAWVRYGGVSLEVDAEAVAWTTRVVAIRWPASGGEHRAWVWVGAVSER